MGVTLIGGGVRSGKSRYALRRAEERFSAGVFVATGEARDEEMSDRILRHQAERGSFWRTIEEPLDLVDTFKGLENQSVVVDCLTLWLSNVILAEDHDVDVELDRLAAVVASPRGGELLLVTNEVGAGIVPENPLAREFRDRAGEMNQRIAAVADEVVWMAFGCPLHVKGPKV